MLLVVRLERPAEPPRYLLVRWRDWPPPALLSLNPPADLVGLEQAIAETLTHRIGVQLSGTPLFGQTRHPVRMRRGSQGSEGMGWLRVAAVRAVGMPEPDVLLEAVLELDLDEALAALSSDVERAALVEAAGLLGDAPTA